jgi:hypothetical protein
VGALKHPMICRVPFPNCRGGVIGLAIAGDPENDGHPPTWQEAAGTGSFRPLTGTAASTTGVTRGRWPKLLQDVVAGGADREAGSRSTWRTGLIPGTRI